jgi:putative addiction module component (TIGR02574 family)
MPSRYFWFMTAEFAPLFKLGRAERLQLVEDLWDSLVGEEDSTPVPDWKRDELRHRKAQYAQHLTSGLVWGDVKQRAR